MGKTLCKRKGSKSAASDTRAGDTPQDLGFFCRKCRRVAAKKKFLCQPRKIKETLTRDGQKVIVLSNQQDPLRWSTTLVLQAPIDTVKHSIPVLDPFIHEV